MPLVTKGQLDDFASAMATKDAIIKADQRNKSEGGETMETSRTSAFIHTSGLSAPAYDTSGNLFGAGTVGKSGYGLIIPKSLSDETLIEYIIAEDKSKYGQVEKQEEARVIVKPLTKVEFEEKKKKADLPIVKFSKDDAEKVSYSLPEKISMGINNFFFASKDEDSAGSLILMIFKLIVTAGIVVGGIGAVSYLVLK